MSEEQEKLGQLIDRLDNVAHALKGPMPAEIHVEALRLSIPDIVDKLKEAFVGVTGENPWES